MEIPYGEIIKWAGGSAVICSGIFAWIGQLIISNKIEKWRSATESKLKLLENQLSEKSLILNNLIDIHKSSHTFSQERRLKAIEIVWSALIDFDSNIPQSAIRILNKIDRSHSGGLSSLQVLSSEINTFRKEIDDTNSDFYKTLEELSKKLAYEKPYLGAEIALKIDSYRNFICNNMMFIANNHDRDAYTHWSKNKNVELFFTMFNFTEASVDYLLNKGEETFDLARGMMFGNIIDEIDKSLTGVSASEKSFENFQMMKAKVDSKNRITS